MRVVRAVKDLDVYIDTTMQRSTKNAYPYDIRPTIPLCYETSTRSTWCLRAISERAMDVANLKISKLGASQRQFKYGPCAASGIAMTLEDSWGGDIATAAIAHLAHSTPTPFRFTSTDFNSYVTVSTATRASARERDNGRQPRTWSRC